MYLQRVSKIAVESSDTGLVDAFRELVEDQLRGAKRDLHKTKVSRICQQIF
jgi:hypothetical protein